MSTASLFSIYVYIYLIRDNDSLYIIYSLVPVEYEEVINAVMICSVYAMLKTKEWPFHFVRA